MRTAAFKLGVLLLLIVGSDATAGLGRSLVWQHSEAIRPQSLASLFRWRPMMSNSDDGPGMTEDAAESMLPPPPVTLPTDLQLESGRVDAAQHPDRFVGLFKRVAHRSGLPESLEQQQQQQQQDSRTADDGGATDILESGHMLEKLQAEGVPTVHDMHSPSAGPTQPPPAPAPAAPAPAASPPQPAPAPAPTPAPAPSPPKPAPTPTPPPAANTSKSATAPAPAPGPGSNSSSAATEKEVDVALIPTDPFAATVVPISATPYTPGSGPRFNDADMHSLNANTGGGMAAFREKASRLGEAATQQSGGSGKLSQGAVAGLVIGILIAVAAVVGFMMLRSRKEKAADKRSVRRPQRYTSSADAEIDVSGEEEEEEEALSPTRSTAARASGASNTFQPGRSAGRFAGGAGGSSSIPNSSLRASGTGGNNGSAVAGGGRRSGPTGGRALPGASGSAAGGVAGAAGRPSATGSASGGRPSAGSATAGRPSGAGGGGGVAGGASRLSGAGSGRHVEFNLPKTSSSGGVPGRR